ncbi:hypothetical protein CPAST_c24560 [Clostridium pasteurianum DSM 525 = ATCC 6013]|uniref:Uncharacterized protein n=1 Tax=Clostridium pasteurianum DSM 525 = ATCC 6013 TaxID=1262449 RepID=A0A0H3J3M3_CLOPA|nr:hypothetical protein [Clostridium pasteurianum]AJA48526.1 hypothetical protein CPAST_c24560 [Clostridium pasteurianum DSM 525 = ATCC 6013]AJA52514.1 hypothetical protein CLPA_c24560 [Clostridium pasteurianum DSM 525 = ATCC 6013]AOZ75764.1 hypothetical protein AQ983_11940 [Clostridium pasteurianum DSM 525 = ATCC 6013]AOZ79560.1 hypothetical protein AQ984_11935 [Clostridium pasteurianum]ELP57992.1 hypothetical protein F502_17375 [Clostridium pasteurianum DSM 525 = ATCC 6013]
MEYNYIKINDRLEELINLRMNKGVQPNELMENITNEEYSKVSAKKFFGGIQCNVEFSDYGIFDNIKSKYEYVYIYDNDMFLKEIRMIKNKIETNIWNKVSEEKKLLDDIMLQLRNIPNSSKYINKFIETLPNDLLQLISDNYSFINIV